MSLRRPVLPKRRAGLKRGPAPLDPVRQALAAITRLRQALTAAGHGDRIGKPATSSELAARERLFGGRPPPSYIAALQMAARIGDPDILLDREAMTAALSRMGKERPHDGRRYFPFGRSKRGPGLLAFDREAASPDGELAVVEWTKTEVTARASSFGEWLDAEADAREEEIKSASSLPNRLRVLLSDLGFRFDYPLVGRLETGDIAAVEELLGAETTALVRGTVDRLFDSSGRASLSLNLDEFSLAVSVRTGIYVFEAEDVFRWLRYFRDENFFGESTKEPSHPDAVRDLRKAPREAAAMRRGVLEVRALPARKHTFRSAAGLSPDDFYLLGRTGEVREDSPSLILHVVRGQVRDAHAVDEPLHDLYVSEEGVLWGLSSSGAAVRFEGGKDGFGKAKLFVLAREGAGRTWWYGIGGRHERVFVWGTGALLELQKKKFVPYEPEPEIGPDENVIALAATEHDTTMLIASDGRGALAHCDGQRWRPIAEEEVLDGALVDFDTWRGVTAVLDRDLGAFRTGKGAPRRLPWPLDHEAFTGEDGRRRPFYSLRITDQGTLVASDGGVMVLADNGPTFHAAAGTNTPARLRRVGPVIATAADSPRSARGAAGSHGAQASPSSTTTPNSSTATPSSSGSPGSAPGLASGVAVTVGPHAWIWKNGAFHVLDVREW